jgi:hypothetical protein
MRTRSETGMAWEIPSNVARNQVDGEPASVRRSYLSRRPGLPTEHAESWKEETSKRRNPENRVPFSLFRRF